MDTFAGIAQRTARAVAITQSAERVRLHATHCGAFQALVLTRMQLSLMGPNQQELGSLSTLSPDEGGG